MKKNSFILMIFIYCIAISADANDKLTFIGQTTDMSATGFYTLRWKAPLGEKINLQTSSTPKFEKAKTIYRGKNRSLFISGLESGQYYYRIGLNNGENSTIFHLTVKHYSIYHAMLFFILGAIVFLSTVIVIFKGDRDAA